MAAFSDPAPSETDLSVSRRIGRWFHRRGYLQGIIAIPYIWLVLWFLIPFIIIFAMSVATRTPTAPPFGFGGENPILNWENYRRLFTDDLYIRAYLTSLFNATMATFFCLIIGYPIALGIARASSSWRSILLMLVILPFWTSFLLRVYAWIGLIGTNAWFNKMITGAWNGLVPEAWEVAYVPLMNTNAAVILVTLYSYLPFMILPLYANLERLDLALDEAAMDLGSKPTRVFWDITVPQSVPGIIAGGMLVFIPACGEFIIPSLVGSASQPMIGRVISDEFGFARDWPMASTVAVALLVLLVVPLMVYTWAEQRAEERAFKREQEE
ncbi:ABC transporter permease [Pseudoroseicyclus sp. CXY001]|uniref:ABC transporter permease n=1 Tax=Pseudoroseicyclus sp. CXY001 TaxID=3242492 RepID=UPI00358DBDF0